MRDVLLKRADYIPERERDEYLRFVTRFQQTTSPVTAKGIEDTAFYVYNRLVSLNEVGGEPAHFGVSPGDLHGWLAERRRLWPSALSTTSTHDTKRSEDVRARISVLSEIPGAWKAALARWSRFNKRHHTTVRGHAAPDRNEEYLLYQTLLGAWPLHALGGDPGEEFVARICEYMIKALREAKRHSSWLNPNPAWEEAVGHFVRQLLHPVRGARFLEDFRPLAARVAQSGMWNSLSQTLIKVTAPGVPDFYQGTEVWNLSLVDPDNRRPVDFAHRQSLLAQLPVLDDGMRGVRLEPDAGIARRRSPDGADGWTHQAVRHRHCAARAAGRPGSLPARRLSPAWRSPAPARPTSSLSRAHTRAARPSSMVPRLTAMLLPDAGTPPVGRRVWADTRVVLPDSIGGQGWRDAFTDHVIPDGHNIEVADALQRFPVALLGRGRIAFDTAGFGADRPARVRHTGRTCAGPWRAHMLYVTVIGALFLTWFVLVLLFTPALDYRIRVRVPVSSPDFLHLLESTCQAATHGGNRAEVFTDGPQFYPAMLAAIRTARRVGQPRVLHLQRRGGCGRVRPGSRGACEGGRGRDDRRRCDWQLRNVDGRDQRAHGRGLPGGVVSAGHVVSARTAEQPDAPGDPGRRRVHRVRGRRRDCRLVDEGERAGAPAVARHDGSPRGPGCRRAAGRVRRELAGVLR